MAERVKEGAVHKIDPKKFREMVRPFDLSCPFCTTDTEMFTTHGCPACGGTKRIDPTPRPDLEMIAEALRGVS